jgi:hypothetical protein
MSLGVTAKVCGVEVPQFIDKLDGVKVNSWVRVSSIVILFMYVFITAELVFFQG